MSPSTTIFTLPLSSLLHILHRSFAFYILLSPSPLYHSTPSLPPHFHLPLLLSPSLPTPLQPPPSLVGSVLLSPSSPRFFILVLQYTLSPFGSALIIGPYPQFHPSCNPSAITYLLLGHYIMLASILLPTAMLSLPTVISFSSVPTTLLHILSLVLLMLHVQ